MSSIGHVNSIVLVVLLVCVLGLVMLARKESLQAKGAKPKAPKAAKGKAAKPSKGAHHEPKTASAQNPNVEILPPGRAPENPFQRPPRVIVIDLPPLRPAR